MSTALRHAGLPPRDPFVAQGYPNLVVKEWFAFFAPGATVKDTIVSQSLVLQNAIARPEMLPAFAQAGMTAVSSSAATLSARIAMKQRYWKPVLQANGIKAES